MNYSINKTDKYHKEDLTTLGWELTISNSLYCENTILRSILQNNEPFGRQLYKYLERYIPISKIENVVEVGGGYGYLMKDFLEMNNAFKSTMIDISPVLIKKQRETLKKYNVAFFECDFLLIDDGILKNQDLAILNENLGDFPTIIDLKKDNLKLDLSEVEDPFIKKIKMIFETYNLPLPEEEIFNFNIGAVNAVEKLCKIGVPYIYIGEHSCEAKTPENLKQFTKIRSTGMPEKISLMGHNEYTIKFSYLEKVGKFYGYKTKRGVFADFIPIRWDKKLKYILFTKGRQGDEEEMICQFIEDLYKYEYLIFIKRP